MQHELIPRQQLSVTPEVGRTDPRLWVRRLVIWREPGVIVREVTLRPGLNIIWSPDPGSGRSGSIGHGGGKTMFCRLLRYCLGEDSFAPDGQRLAIWGRFPNMRVGAEVMLDDEVWAVVRSLGSRKHDVVSRGGSLDEASQDGAAATGIYILHDAIAQAIIGDAARLMPSSIGPARAWEAALAWSTRDQECRFAHHLEWRDPRTDSHSPVRGRSVDDRITIVRALMRAIANAELEVLGSEAAVEMQERSIRSELGSLDGEIKRTRATLANAFGDGPGPGLGLDEAYFKSAAAASYFELLSTCTTSAITDIKSARAERDGAAHVVRTLEGDLRESRVRIEERTKSLLFMRSQLPEAKARLVKENNPVCPICEVPIDKALAEGCGISTKTCDLEAIQGHIAKLRENIAQEQTDIERLGGLEVNFKQDIAIARQRLEPLEQAVAALEQALLDQSQSNRALQRLIDEAEKYEALLIERDDMATRLQRAEGQLKTARETLAVHRTKARESLRGLSTAFDAVFRELIPDDVSAEVTLDGNGLALKVEIGGERSTAAIESLKAVVFDLASLVMTVEGKTRLSGFLVHDSPREADLGRSIYDRLFAFAKRLETSTPTPLFQYIVTTTTEPPAEFLSKPWLRLTLRGAPAEERLLMVDL